MGAAGEWGYTVAPEDGGGDIMHSLAEAGAPRHGDQTPKEWLKANLFGSIFSTIFSIVFGFVALYLGYRLGKFVFQTARWEPVRANLELFMVGLFPRSERTRLVVHALLIGGAGGLLLGWIRERSLDTAEKAGLVRPSTSFREIAGIYWGIAAFILFCMVVGVRTLDPWLLLIGFFLAALVGYASTIRMRGGVAGVLLKILPLAPFVFAAAVLSLVPDLNNQGAYTIAAGLTVLLALVRFIHIPELTMSAGLLVGTSGFMTLSGTQGLMWLFVTGSLMPIVLYLVGLRSDDLPPIAGWIGSAVCAASAFLLFTLSGFGLDTVIVLGIALTGVAAAARGEAATGARLGALTVVAVLAWQIGRLIDLPGIDWDDWGGLQLNITAAAATTILAFPIGLLLALGRRSSLPVLRFMCTAYIEVFRGVPLITLLFMAQLFIGFFLNGQNLPLVTKSIIVFTMFSSAYIAEIVRGGLQAVPKGQTEAGQAMGMSPAGITRLLVLPQALKAVIPAMVGQFISLFKDTSLLAFIGIPEFLGVREIVHAQTAFRGFGIAESLVFVAFGFWAISFTMSRESQRLERRLDTGNR
ncbi:amino acid ABC transporter permease [Ilumatobacter sp.]|uniref:amino acid ABC transporter permease n=1 Tax=Ilumatobacter sp. TaxID=1967498 RepID=UPI003C508764